MKLVTTRFGEIMVDLDAVITFTQPIIGFQEYRRFITVPGPPQSGLTWLQSTDSGELAFLMMHPRDVVPDYRVPLSRHELAELAAPDADSLEVYTLLVVPADRKKIRTNLRAPILISRGQRLGKQAVLERTDYPIQFYLAAAKAGARPDGEVSNAGADT
jgi:flagellar assembly factor FliW